MPTNERSPAVWPMAALIVLLAIVAYHGVVLLGHGTDSVFDQEMYRRLSLATVAADPVYNRYPMWGLVVYPLMLAGPLWLGHVLPVVAHTLAAALFFFLLREFRLNNLVALIAACLYLLWPSNYETLLWLSGGMFTFGALFLVAGALVYARGRAVSGALLLFAGMLFSEGLFLPTLFLVAVIALVLRKKPIEGGVLGAVLVALYGLFQVLRYTTAAGRDFTPYGIGFAKAIPQFREWLWMAFGLTSSQDVAWMWERAFPTKDVGLLLPTPFLVGALVVGLGVVLLARRLAGPVVPPNRVAVLLGLSLAVLGFVSAGALFALIVNNAIQARYTTVGALALAAGLGIGLGALASNRSRPLAIVGIALATLLLGNGLFRAWSNVWVNGYPANLMNEVILEDIRATYEQTGVANIFVLDDASSVGNAYALGRPWGYAPAGRMYIGPDIDVRNDEMLVLVSRPDFAPGIRFSDAPCVFLTWQNGQREIAQQVRVAGKDAVLNCVTGVVDPLGEPAPMLTFYATNTGAHNLEQLRGAPVDPMTLNQQLLARLRSIP